MRKKGWIVGLILVVALILAIAGSAYALAGPGGAKATDPTWVTTPNSTLCPNAGNPAACPGPAGANCPGPGSTVCPGPGPDRGPGKGCGQRAGNAGANRVNGCLGPCEGGQAQTTWQ